MKKLFSNKYLMLLIFLSLFGFSIGLFDNYRELWMSTNNLSANSISLIISISNIITVLALIFFTLKISPKKLKNGITITLILEMLTSTFLVCLNNSNKLFLIKFTIFFNIAFNEIILSSIYPLIMHIDKNDEIYTKKSVVESIFNKLGFLIVTLVLGKSIGHFIIDYNTCLLLSIIFQFLAFMVLINIDLKITNKNTINLQKSFKYFNKNKVLYLFLLVNLIGSIAWSAILGMPMLTLTNKLNLSPSTSSFIILTMGIISNILAMLIVKYFKSQNDHINLFFKYGFRFILYLSIILSNNPTVFLISLIILLINDCTYTFIFSGYFINNIKGDYTLLLVILKYCTSLLGKGLGVFICGLVFSLDIKYLVIPTFIIAIIHYILSTILINKKHTLG